MNSSATKELQKKPSYNAQSSGNKIDISVYSRSLGTSTKNKSMHKEKERVSVKVSNKPSTDYDSLGSATLRKVNNLEKK